jgi:hypothetical protein
MTYPGSPYETPYSAPAARPSRGKRWLRTSVRIGSPVFAGIVVAAVTECASTGTSANQEPIVTEIDDEGARHKRNGVCHKQEDRTRINLKWLVEHFSVIIGAVGLLVYGTVRLTYQAFYGVFNLSPESVGLTYLSILAPTVSVLVIYLLTLVLLVGPLVAVSRPLGKWLTNQGIVVAYASVIILLVAFTAAIALWLRSSELAISLWGIPALITLVVLAALEVKHQRTPGNFTRKGRRSIRFPLWFWSTFISLAAVLTLASAYNAGIAAGENVKNGGSISIKGPFSWVISVQAEPVQMVWADKSAAEKLFSGEPDFTALTYLGEADGTIVLLDRSACEILKVPASSVITKSTTRVDDATAGCSR